MGGFGRHDPEWEVAVGSVWENGTYQWLTYLGTDGNEWQTRTHCTNNGSGYYSITIESQRPDGSGNNPTFQIVDWQGQKWNVTGLTAVYNGGNPSPVRIGLQKI